MLHSQRDGCRLIITTAPEARITLRIVTWNCNMALHSKAERLRSLQPDVAIIQECAAPDAAGAGWRLDCTAFDWIGFNPDKGLGVFTFGDLRLTRHPSYCARYALYLPVSVLGWCSFNVLGVWSADPRRIPAAATNDPQQALQHYLPFLAAAPAVVAGDFNRLPQQMTGRRSGSGSSIAECLAQAGLSNADYQMSDLSGQRALRRTHYHQRKLTRGFVVDYVFASAALLTGLSAFEVCDPHDWITWSDHVPLIAEFDLAGVNGCDGLRG